MDNKSSWSSCTFELEDIEIIDHQTEFEEKLKKWHCDQCSLFFLDKGKLDEHKKKHVAQNVIKCKYCNKDISSSSTNKESYVNRKCETCEYKCSKCPQRFLRHSSLVNHERKHGSPKKKRMRKSIKQINGVAAENVAGFQEVKGKVPASDIKEQSKELPSFKTINSKNKKKIDVKAPLKINDNTPKATKRLSFKSSKPDEESLPLKSPKRLNTKTAKSFEKNNSDIKSNLTAANSQTVTPTSNVSTSENVVNYKPFSCHICGDTFASDNALLDHIRTHGENAANNFKCKFCGDKFDDIYKMQYHLAICPLAEDELETSLKQIIPLKLQTKNSAVSSTPRKRGRPKRSTETPVEVDEEESTPSSSKRRKRRKSIVLQENDTTHNSFGPTSPKQLKQSESKEVASRSHSRRVSFDSTNLVQTDDITEVSKENEPDERKKIHQCPFPRCDFKFTREKALLCHMRNHSDDFDDSLKCHKCDIPFDDIHALRQHINTCKGIKEEKDDDFHRANSLDVSPSRTFHRSKKDFVCNQCGRSFQNQENLDRHLESCESKFVCRICKDDFHNQPLLDEHFGAKHPPYTAYHCFVCEEDFISELFLQIHRSDEHGVNLNTHPSSESVKQKLNSPPQRNDQVTSNDVECVFTNTTVKKNSLPNSPQSRYTKRNHGNTVTGRNSTNLNRSPQYCWCPVCVVGFDSRGNMRAHFREEHVVEIDSTYICEICEVRMPTVEMMCYHLELHSSNPLSVNRFSKLLNYAHQNKLTGLRGSQVKIKFEEVSDEELPQVKDDTVKAHDGEPTKALSDSSKMSSVDASHQKHRRSKTRHRQNQITNEKGVESIEENRFTNGSIYKSKKLPAKKEEERLKNSVTVQSVNSAFNRIEQKQKNKNEMDPIKPSRPRRSKVNYCFRNEVEGGFVKQSVKSEKDSVEKISFEPNSSMEKIEIIDVDQNNTVAAKDDLGGRQTRGSGRVKRVRTIQKKNTSVLESKFDTENTVSSSETKSIGGDTENILPDENGSLNSPQHNIPMNSSKLTLVHDKSELEPLQELHTEREVKSLSSAEGDLNNKQSSEDSLLVTEGEVKSSDGLSRRQCTEDSSLITGGEMKTSGGLGGKQLSEDSSSTAEKSEASRGIRVNCSNGRVKDVTSDIPVNREHVDINTDPNIDLKENSVRPVTPEQKNQLEIEDTLNKAAEGSHAIAASANIPEESGCSRSCGITQQLKESGDLCNRNLIKDSSKGVNEEVRASITSTARESEKISCKMCTESFNNQEDLLDHLDTHI